MCFGAFDALQKAWRCLRFPSFFPSSTCYHHHNNHQNRVTALGNLRDKGSLWPRKLVPQVLLPRFLRKQPMKVGMLLAKIALSSDSWLGVTRNGTQNEALQGYCIADHAPCPPTNTGFFDLPFNVRLQVYKHVGLTGRNRVFKPRL